MKSSITLQWPGKTQAILSAQRPTNKVLKQCFKDSVGRDNTIGSIDSCNLYIEGDNLDVLKLLQFEYQRKIKLIYIDPPYNTGNDFVYEDNYHEQWLNMMYPRLVLARNLLREDGSIFVNIDFHESANLRKIMDEIFGEQNFQREIIWRMGWLSGYKTTARNFIRNHDTILFYSKNSSKLAFFKCYIKNKDFKPLVSLEKGQLKDYLDNIGLNLSQQKQLVEVINHDSRPTQYPIEDTWNCNEYDDLNSIAITSFSNEKISKILEVDQEFKGQKSIKMLQRIIEATTSDEDIILDFFSGSGSTAHAVFLQNLQDRGHRKFIMVQIPKELDVDSPTYKLGYRTLCDIGTERIHRCGQNLRIENPLTSMGLDTGFQLWKCVEFNEEILPTSFIRRTIEDIRSRPSITTSKKLF